MPPLRVPKFDVHSVGFKMGLELAAGAVLTAMLLRWVAF